MGIREEIERDLQIASDNQPDIASYLNGEKSLEEISNIQSAFNILAMDYGALKQSVLRLADEVDVAQKS